ncbi:MAG TPA: hypothetical protein VGM56_19695 [Byssovorax sp.]|jgi:hypothetical protein
MRQSTHVIFDEFIPKSTTTTTPVYTGAQHNAQLGRHNQLGVHAVIDNLTPNTSGTTRNLLCYLEVSNDGRNWIQRSNQESTGGTPASTDAELLLSFGSSDTTVQRYWSDACEGKSIQNGSPTITGPLLGFVRVRMFFDDATVAGHLRLTVVQRDM